MIKKINLDIRDDEYDSLPQSSFACKQIRIAHRSTSQRRASGILRGKPEDPNKKSKRLSGPCITYKASPEELEELLKTDGKAPND